MMFQWFIISRARFAREKRCTRLGNLLAVALTAASLSLISHTPATASFTSEIEFGSVLTQMEEMGYHLSICDATAETAAKDLDCSSSFAPDGPSGYTAIVHVKAQASEVYRAALREIEARPYLKMLRQDDEKYMVEVSGGKKMAILRAIPINKNKQTKIIVTADVTQKGLTKQEELKREKNLALKAITVLCNSLGVKYELVKCTPILAQSSQLPNFNRVNSGLNYLKLN